MVPASLHARDLHGSAGMTEMATLDLELRLGLPVVIDAPRNTNADQSSDMVRKSYHVEQPACARSPVLLQLFPLQPLDMVLNSMVPASGNLGTPTPAEVAEPICNHAKSEPANPPPAPRVATDLRHDTREAQEGKPADLHLPVVHQQGDAGATEPAWWIRAELLPRHGLPTDLPLHFVEDKVLQRSDLHPTQNRLLLRCAGFNRLRALLSVTELDACGIDGPTGSRKRPARVTHGGKTTKRRAASTSYPGVPVLVHGRNMARAAVKLRLTTFHSSAALVINGRGYNKEIVAGSGFETGDVIEVWAFRRPRDRHLCLVVAKRSEPAASEDDQSYVV
jgi:hypothetical protein